MFEHLSTLFPWVCRNESNFRVLCLEMFGALCSPQREQDRTSWSSYFSSPCGVCGVSRAILILRCLEHVLTVAVKFSLDLVPGKNNRKSGGRRYSHQQEYTLPQGNCSLLHM